MKVLWIHQNLVTGKQAGNNRAVRIAAALIEAGAELNLIAGDKSYFGDSVADGVQTEGRLTLHRLKLDAKKDTKGASYIEFNRKAFSYARRLCKPDIVFCSSPPLPQFAASAALARLWQIPLALEIRDLWPAFVIEGGLLREGIMAQLMRALEALAYRSAGSLISVSPGFNPYLERMTSVNITTAPTGGDRRLFEAPATMATAWRQRNGIEGPMVLYAGSFNAAYGISKLLGAAEQSDATWVFAGNGADRHLVEAAKVRYLGSVPRTDLFPAILAANVGINSHASWPLLESTITGKLFDYMAAGIPVVSLCDGQMGEIVRASGCGVVTQDIAAGVQELLMHPEKGDAGRKWLMRNMHADTMARKAARAILQAQPRGLLRHIPGALFDMCRSRSQQALQKSYGGGRQQIIRDAFNQWQLESRHDVFMSEPLALPDLLS